MIRHASIVPLIGGNTIAQQNVYGSRPDYLLSYSPFRANDSHIVNHYKGEVPYILLDESGKHPHKVDVVNTTCPCAGLSSLSVSASGNSAMNEWMFRSAEYVLGKIVPAVFWGENAPRLSSALGQPVVKRLRAIGKEHGYTFSIFETKSLLHGLSQVRNRTFYFFWRGEDIPIFEYVNKLETHDKIEDTIARAHAKAEAYGPDPMSHVFANTRVPSEEPFYRYLLQAVHSGISHAEFSKGLTRSANVLDCIEGAGHEYGDVAAWFRKNGLHQAAKKADRMHLKLKSGGNIMRKQTEIPHGHIGAFVGHMPIMLTHPTLDRYISIRESLEIMAMPPDFQLLNPTRAFNHICQNVPVSTAEHPARMIQKFLEGGLERVRSEFLIQSNKNHSIRGMSTGNLDQFLHVQSASHGVQ